MSNSTSERAAFEVWWDEHLDEGGSDKCFAESVWQAARKGTVPRECPPCGCGSMTPQDEAMVERVELVERQFHTQLKDRAEAIGSTPDQSEQFMLLRFCDVLYLCSNLRRLVELVRDNNEVIETVADDNMDQDAALVEELRDFGNCTARPIACIDVKRRAADRIKALAKDNHAVDESNIKREALIEELQAEVEAWRALHTVPVTVFPLAEGKDGG